MKSLKTKNWNKIELINQYSHHLEFNFFSFLFFFFNYLIFLFLN